MTNASPFEDVSFALHEIGSKDSLTPDEAKRAAIEFVKSRAALPDAEHMIVVGGYDTDPRELWDIPEAKEYVRRFAGWVMLHLNLPLQAWKLEPASIGLIGVCTGVGRIIGRDPVTKAWNVEIGRRPA